MLVLPRPEGITKLAAKRLVKIPSVGVFDTPMLVPSFSSKGFPKLRHIIQNCAPFIDAQVLVSAYDFAYGYLPEDLSFPSLIFLDSGGYEARKECDLSEYFDSLNAEYRPQVWTEELFEDALTKFQPLSPVVHVSYDHPARRISISEQVAAALKFGGAATQFCRELLIKPTTERRFLDIDDVIANVKKFASFSVIGVTEEEIGSSLLERMANIARLRLALQKAGLDTPIHVFGSLDTFSTLLYFVMGADIFDGLTWLRYGYDEGRTVYRHELAALNFPSNTNVLNAEELCLRHNYIYLKKMSLRMRAYLTTGEFSELVHNTQAIERLAIQAWGELGEG